MLYGLVVSSSQIVVPFIRKRTHAIAILSLAVAENITIPESVESESGAFIVIVGRVISIIVPVLAESLISSIHTKSLASVSHSFIRILKFGLFAASLGSSI